MTFVQVTFTYPEFPKKEFDPFLWEARRKGILTLFLFSKVGADLLCSTYLQHPDRKPSRLQIIGRLVANARAMHSCLADR
jgi:hypothetical protein